MTTTSQGTKVIHNPETNGSVRWPVTGYTYTKTSMPSKLQIIELRNECLRLGMTGAAAAWDNALEVTRIDLDKLLEDGRNEHEHKQITDTYGKIRVITSKIWRDKHLNAEPLP